jgi:tRNA A37 methylthiotransferase MiaB
VDDPKAADLSLVWTCGGFDRTEARSLRTVRRAVSRSAGDGQVVATGCLIKIHPEALGGIGAKIVTAERLSDLDGLIGATIPFDAVPEVGIISGVCDLVAEPVATRVKRQLQTTRGVMGRVVTSLRHRLACSKGVSGGAGVIPTGAYSLLVSRGCLNACTYCSIRIAMGRLRSRPLPEIVSQCKEAISEGHRMFVLIGEDVGAYGVDLGLDVCDLLGELLSVPGDHRVIINDFNARWLVRYGDELVDTMERYQDKIEGLVVPIQSGSDRILRLMRRGYEIGEVQQALARLKERAPGLRVTTHVLTGFPTESDEDFEASLRLLKNNDFWHVDVFPYEERSMTPSARITPKTPPGVIVKRAGILCEVAEECTARNRV